ncbi:hypothetical protein [Synechococcus sp. PCC 7336]|uniref:hypothetical protein n=1 Tax=Synechococcus sp. PCC 7336 TaxID=195250 RepID=UPI00034839F5|nr:hypothetical protein [Synechococcus sp. PCC 7336]
MSTPTQNPQDPSTGTKDAYSKPASGLFCLLGPGGRIAGNAEGKVCCFESEAEAEEFLQTHPELSEQLSVQEVFVKGEVHGWEQVPAETVEERSLKELDS